MVNIFLAGLTGAAGAGVARFLSEPSLLPALLPLLPILPLELPTLPSFPALRRVDGVIW